MPLVKNGELGIAIGQNILPIRPAAARKARCPTAAGRICVSGFSEAFNSLVSAFISGGIPKPLLMPLVHFPLCLKPVSEICAVFVTALMPQFMRTLGDLFFQTHALVHTQGGHRGFSLTTFAFHKRSTFAVWA